MLRRGKRQEARGNSKGIGGDSANLKNKCFKFGEPDLNPPDDNPEIAFTRANYLAFDIAPEGFDFALEVLQSQGITIASEPVTRPTGRGVYFYDPDGFIVEIRCDPAF